MANRETKKPSGKYSLLLVLFVIIACSWGVYEARYYFSKWSDYRNRPWAYNSDPEAKLLVGRWQGAFTDPDGVSKNITLSVYEPTTDDERKAKAGRRNRRGGGLRYSDKASFDGIADVRSKLGTEAYEVYGSVQKDDYHRFKCSFRPADESRRILPNFALLQGLDGIWDNDELQITFSFSYLRKDGSGFSSSADPRFDKQAAARLRRIP